MRKFWSRFSWIGQTDSMGELLAAEMPSAPSLDRTRQRKLLLNRSNSSFSMTIGDVNNVRRNTGSLRIASSFAYLALIASLRPPAAARVDDGSAAAAPPASAVDRNVRR